VHVGRESIGELEHLILLAILALRENATAIRVRRRLETEGRGITRGALYRSLDRLGEKELIEFRVEEPSAERGGHAARLYSVSTAGLDVVRERRATLERLWADAAEAAR
jgi:DNA-binding PadR family transcriptional regulator